MAKPKKRSGALNEVWGILCLFSGLFVLLGLLSYNHSDPSLFTRTQRGPFNYGGRVGANIAEALIQFDGLAAFLAALMFFAFSANFLKGATRARLLFNLGWHLIGMITAATLLSLIVGPVNFGATRISSGGIVGAWLASVLLHYLNMWGATLFTLCMLMIALVFSTSLSAATLLRYVFAFAVAVPFWILAGFRATAQIIRKAKTEKLIAKNITDFTDGPEIPEPKRAERPLFKPTAAAAVEIATAGLSLLDDATDFEVVPPSAIAPKKPAARKPAHKAATSTAPGSYTLPSLDFLNEPSAPTADFDKTRLRENSKILETKLTDFGIEGNVVAVRPGPVITMYEFKPGPGVKISQIAALADDLSLALSAQSVRIVAPIPGKSVVGIEIPNDNRERVLLREILSTEEFQGGSQGIPLAIGKDISGAPVVSDLARMPHLLIAGAPGAGKSVFINSLICSLLYKFTPNDMRLIMVDPKQLELNLYDDIPHLLLPVVDDPKKASTALKWAVNEMERRYKIMAKSGIRNLAGFNQKLEKDGEQKMRELLCPQDEAGMPCADSLSHLFEHDEKGLPRVDHLPFILVIIDEFADLMMVAPKDIETSVARLAQKARAAGIHLVIATQRPSVDVITGLIKANLPSRISFQVASKVDSRTILDCIGSEKLLGQGDMLFIPPGLSRLSRIHGAFVNEDEIGKLCGHWRAQGAPVYKEEILIEPEDTMGDEADGAGDELYGQAVSIVREMGQASASMIQRRLKVGYNRAARMVEAMEAQGIVGPSEGAKPREVLI